MRRRELLVVASMLLTLLAIIPFSTQAAWEQLDQSAPPASSGSWIVNDAGRAQTFTAGMTGDLSRVRLPIARLEGEARIEIRTTDAGVPTGNGEPNTGTVLASATLTSHQGSATDVVFDPPAPIQSDTQYAIVLTTTGRWAWRPAESEYASGEGWFCSSTCTLQEDLAFETYVRPTDTTEPSGTISINNDATYTNSTLVTLSLTCRDDVSGCNEMQFSTDGTTFSTPEPFATSASFTLPAGDDTKTVYAQFIDEAGNVSTAVSDTIILDATAPVIELLDDQTLDPTSSAGASVFFTPIVSDNLSSAGDITAVCVDQNSQPFVSGQIAPIGMTTITCSATDLAGNTTSEHFTVNVHGVAGLFSVLKAQVSGLPLPSLYRQSLLLQVGTAERLANMGWTPLTCMSLTALDTTIRFQELLRQISQKDAVGIYTTTEAIRILLGCGGSSR